VEHAKVRLRRQWTSDGDASVFIRRGCRWTFELP